MKKMKAVILILSLSLGLTGTLVFGEYLPEPAPVRTQQTVWWGGMFPEYCLPGAMELTEEEGEPGEEIPVRIRFKYLTFLNESGE